MKTKHWLALWGVMFIICALLGFIPDPQGLVKAVCVLAAAAFFLPPGVLLQQFAEERNVKGLKAIALAAAASLGATLVLLLSNVLIVTAPEWVGNVLYGALVVVSAPMVCSRFWSVALFAWACVMMTAFSAWRKAKKQSYQL